MSWDQKVNKSKHHKASGSQAFLPQARGLSPPVAGSPSPFFLACPGLGSCLTWPPLS